MWYRICMVTGARADAARVYVEALQWRRIELQARLLEAVASIKTLTQQEAALRNELRSVDYLLAAAGSPPTTSDSPPRATSPDGAPANHAASDRREETGDFSAFGPTARRIYACAEQVIREAGVPLHYRVLAEEIQKTVPLSGADPGATLIAHLHRAQTHFPRVGRGIYGLHDMAEVLAEPAAASPPTKKRRRKTRRRTR